jgi:uncharacterized protein with HEPN domain
MKTFTKKELRQCLADVPNNVSRLIDYVIHFDEEADLEAVWKIIHAIERLPNEELVQVLLEDFKTRNLDGKPTLHYDAFFYALVNTPETYEMLKKRLPNMDDAFKVYLRGLNEGKGHDSDLNIQRLFEESVS